MGLTHLATTREQHEFVTDWDNKTYPIQCAICGERWKRQPAHGKCAGLPVYRTWEDVPPNLKTKTQLSEQGCKPAKDQPIVAYKFSQYKSSENYYELYEVESAIPKRKPTEAQTRALAKAQVQAQKAPLVCHRCGEPSEEEYTQKRRDQLGAWRCEDCQARDNASAEARAILEDDFVILDTETTALYDAHIVQIAIIDQHGNPLLDTLVRPNAEGLQELVEGGSIRIHGITPDMLTNAPSISELWPQLTALLAGKTVIIYNASYDTSVLWSEAQRHALPKLKIKSTCAMHLYAQYVGERRWEKDGREWDWSYKWQPLPGGDHTALGDCLATLAVLKAMADSEKDSEKAN